jgi:hypothetical protein
MTSQSMPFKYSMLSSQPPSTIELSNTRIENY